MAEFTQRQSQQEPPAYVGYSQGVRQTENNAAEIIGRGLAKAFGDLVAAADQQVKNDIGDTAAETYDNLNKEFGLTPDAMKTPGSQPQVDVVPGANAPGGQLVGPKTPVPAGLDSQLNSVRTLGVAMTSADGRSRLNYEARLTTMVSDLRAKYPGYRPEIDKIVAQVTGQRPEAELQQEIWSARGKTDPTLDAYEKLVTRMRDTDGTLPVDFYSREKPYDFFELSQIQADKQREKAEVADANAKMALDASLNKQSVEDVTKNYKARANQFVTSSLADSSSVIGSSYADLVKAITAKDAMDWTPEYKEELKVKLHAAEQAMRLGLDTITREQWNNSPDPTHNFASQLPAETIKDTNDQAMAQFKFLEDALVSGDAAALKASASYIQASKDKAVQKLLKDYPVFAEINAVREVMGAEGAALYYEKFPEVQSAIGDVLTRSNHSKVQSFNGDAADAPSIAQDFKTVQDNPDIPVSDKKAYFKNEMATWQKFITSNEDIPPEALAKDINYYFGPKNYKLWATMDAPSRASYFTQMTSPEITKTMMELRDKGDQKSWATYKEWTFNTFQALTKDSFDKLSDFNIDENKLEVQYNPRTNQLVFVNNPGYTEDNGIFSRGLGAIVQGMWDTDEQQAAQGALKNLNTLIGNVAPILKDDEQPIPEQIQLLIGKNHIKPTEGTLSNSVIKALTPQREAGAPPTDTPADPGYWDKQLPFQPQFRGVGETGVTKDAPVAATPVLNLLGTSEGTDKGRGYDETLGYGQFTEGPVNLTSMTLAQVKQTQSDILSHPGNTMNSSAVGRYQIVKSTLKTLQKQMGLSDDTIFTPELQDRMAVELMKGRGLEEWRRGKISDADFLDNLSKEWASLPTAAGTGYYSGQDARTTPQAVLAALKENPYPDMAFPEFWREARGQLDPKLIAFATKDMETYNSLPFAGKVTVLEHMVDPHPPTATEEKPATRSIEILPPSEPTPQGVTMSDPFAGTKDIPAPEPRPASVPASTETKPEKVTPQLVIEKAGIPADPEGAKKYFAGLDRAKADDLKAAAKASGIPIGKLIDSLNPAQKAALEGRLKGFHMTIPEFKLWLKMQSLFE